MLQAIDKDLRTHLHVIVYLQIYEYTYYIDILNIYTYMNIYIYIYDYIYIYIYILVAPALSTLERLFRLGIRVPACEQMAIRHCYQSKKKSGAFPGSHLSLTRNGGSWDLWNLRFFTFVAGSNEVSCQILQLS